MGKGQIPIPYSNKNLTLFENKAESLFTRKISIAVNFISLCRMATIYELQLRLHLFVTIVKKLIILAGSLAQ